MGGKIGGMTAARETVGGEAITACDHGAELIVTPCPLCQANVEIYQSEINRKQGTKLNMPVLYYSQLMAVAYGGTVREADLDGHVIQPTKLQAFGPDKVAPRMPLPGISI